MQNDPVVSKASQLMRLGLMPSPDEVRAGRVECCFTLGFCVLICYIGRALDLISSVLLAATKRSNKVYCKC
jgi:hypothetical protein